MELFQINDLKASRVKKVKRLSVGKLGSNLEKDIQELFESNLEELLGIKHVASEHIIKDDNGDIVERVDTLGQDKNKTLCIIEFKRGSGDEAHGQIQSYQATIESNILAFKYSCIDKGIEIENIDCKSPRALIFAEKYSSGIINRAKKSKIELWTYRIYSKDILYIHRVDKNEDKSSTQSKTRSKKPNASPKKRKSYSIKNHLAGTDKQIGKLFRKFRDKILGLENVNEEARQRYIAYKVSTNITDIVVQKRELKIYLNVKRGGLKVSRRLIRDVRDVSGVGHYGNGDYEVTVREESDLEKFFPFILQSYDINKAKVKAKKSKK